MEKSNFKKFLLLWMGQLIAAIGGGLTSFGLGVYVFEKREVQQEWHLLPCWDFFRHWCSVFRQVYWQTGMTGDF